MRNNFRCRSWLILAFAFTGASLAAAGTTAPLPLLKTGTPADWWFGFKFNAETAPSCGGTIQRVCLLGGDPQPYKHFGLQFAFASNLDPTLKLGGGCIGETVTDPLGATVNQVYKGSYFFVLWNDQFYGDPVGTEGAPAGHSKGMLAWNKAGAGFVLQVSTPSWPGSGSSKTPRAMGNTLGCVKEDNNVLVSQHFFALKVTKADVVKILNALTNASVVTKPAKPQIVKNGGPADIQALVNGLGKVSKSKTATKDTLSSGVVLISKPSDLNVPPWQLVSAELDGEPLRVANWWATPEIPSTTATTAVGCWDASLPSPGAVEIATSGTWAGNPIGFMGVGDADGNHAKIGISTGTHKYTIFGDMNQQGSLSPSAAPPKKCTSSQNGRGGLFYVVENPSLFSSVQELLKGTTAPAN
jgi:hypothetical protein